MDWYSNTGQYVILMLVIVLAVFVIWLYSSGVWAKIIGI